MISNKRFLTSVTALAVMGASTITIPNAVAQENTEPAVTDTNVSTDTNGQNTIAEFPSPVFKENTSESSVVVNGTKDWSSELSLSPEGNASVTANIKINGEVPDGAKVGIYNGNELIQEATVSGGSVKVAVSDLPKDVHTFQIKSDEIDLSNMKCTADKGIDIPESKDKTLDAVTDYEDAYEEAKAKYISDLAAWETSNQGGDNGAVRTVVTKLPDETRVVDIPAAPDGEEGQLPVTPDSGPQQEEIINVFEDVLPGDSGWQMTPGFKAILGVLGTGAGAALLGGLLGNTNLQALQNQFGADFLNNPQLQQILGQIQGMLQGRGGSRSLQEFIDKTFPNSGIGVAGIERQINNTIKQLQEQASNIGGSIENALSGLGINVPGGINIGNQLNNFLNNVNIEDLGKILLGLIVTGLLIGLIVEGLKGRTTNPDVTETRTETQNVPGNPEEGELPNEPTAQQPSQTTTVIPGSTVTTTVPIDSPDAPQPPAPEAPQPPVFIEEELGVRDVNLTPVSGGVEFDIEAGSILDCDVDLDAAPVNNDDTTDPTNDPSTPNRPDANVPNNPSLVANERFATCEDVLAAQASGILRGALASSDPRFNQSLDLDGNGIACDEVAAPVQAPQQVVAQPLGTGGGNTVAAPAIKAVPVKAGPAVNTGGEVANPTIVDRILSVFK